METKEIIESGFTKAFIEAYFEYKIHSFYPTKDRLLYVLCNTDSEKQQITTKQIEIIKSEIQKLGNEELSFGYLLSCKPKSISAHHYIEPEERFEFWLNSFNKYYIESITFTPIIEAYELLKNKFSDEDFEDEFWNFYPVDQKPKDPYLIVVITREYELLNQIEFTISEFKENDYWDFDFEEYQKFIDTSNPIEHLFNISELLVQLNRLEMFNELILLPQQAETKTDKLKTVLANYGFFELSKVKELSEQNKQTLIEFISTNSLPYSIAMFDFLGFLKHIETEHFKTKDKLNKEVAKWFNSAKDGRTVKGNISSLSDHSTENKSKYTAHIHKETVITDYQKLK
jgi:hypothetical protein